MVKCNICNKNKGQEKILLFQKSLKREIICKECYRWINEEVANKI